MSIEGQEKIEEMEEEIGEIGERLEFINSDEPLSNPFGYSPRKHGEWIDSLIAEEKKLENRQAKLEKQLIADRF